MTRKQNNMKYQKTHWAIQPSLTDNAKYRYMVITGFLSDGWEPTSFVGVNTWEKSKIGADDEQELFKVMKEKHPELTYVEHELLHIRV